MLRISHQFSVLALAVLAGSVSAEMVYDGSVTGPSGSWGFVDFYYGGGDLAIDSWASGFTKGPTGGGIDDIYLSLFSNNGSSRNGFTGAFIASNDDSGGFGDGSTSGADSYLSLPSLSEGYYTLAVSRCCNNFASVRNESVLNSGIGGNRDFRLTFSSAVTIGVAPEPLPEPTPVVISRSVGGPDGTWGFVDFVHNGGALSINALANGYTNGPTGQGIDDTNLALFVDDGSVRSAFTGALIATNDDNRSPLAFSDGSTSPLDSLIELSDLAAGKYTLTIGRCCNSFAFYRNDLLLNSGIQGDKRDYQLTFTGDVVVASVPEPGYASLGLLGLAGLGWALRRRDSRMQADA